jgi:hypothetical protein
VPGETGRSLTCETCSSVRPARRCPVHASAHVARRIGAGFLVTRSLALREVADLHQYIDTLVSVTSPVACPVRLHPSARSQQPSLEPFLIRQPVSPHLDPSTDQPASRSAQICRLR